MKTDPGSSIFPLQNKQTSVEEDSDEPGTDGARITGEHTTSI
jgi:hypothetical protein